MVGIQGHSNPTNRIDNQQLCTRYVSGFAQHKTTDVMTVAIGLIANEIHEIMIASQSVVCRQGWIDAEFNIRTYIEDIFLALVLRSTSTNTRQPFSHSALIFRTTTC